MKTFSWIHCLCFWLMSLTLWTKTQTVNLGFVRPCDPMPLEFLPCIAFSLGIELVHVQAVPGSSIDSPVVTPRHDNVK